jgi:hypothetical protein|tara:strand:+ start:1027 stop:1263 length:237 start_codon:yes stop_codon:yes gene_type:complete
MDNRRIRKTIDYIVGDSDNQGPERMIEMIEQFINVSISRNSSLGNKRFPLANFAYFLLHRHFPNYLEAEAYVAQNSEV